MDAKREFERLVKSLGAVHIRSKRHNIYRLPNGRTFGVSKTPECSFAWNHAVADICIAANIPKPNWSGKTKSKNENRREKAQQRVLQASRIHVPSPSASPRGMKEALQEFLQGKDRK